MNIARPVAAFFAIATLLAVITLGLSNIFGSTTYAKSSERAGPQSADTDFIDAVNQFFAFELLPSSALLDPSAGPNGAKRWSHTNYVYTAPSSGVRGVADTSSGLRTGLGSPLVSTGIVISQVYGGGGNGGSTYTNDFIELFNLGNSPIDVTGWSVQYASAAGSTWTATILSGTIPAGGYYLIQEAVGAGGTTPLPTPDATGAIAMSATAGKVALVNNSTALTGACPAGATIIDLIGFGPTANCSETSPAPAPGNTTGDLRASEGCLDSDTNSTDFSAVAPSPRNSASSLHSCAASPTPTPTATGTPTATATPPASMFVVNSTADTDDGMCTATIGGCTLREAVNTANSNVDASAITFDPAVFLPGPNTIDLGNALADLSTNINITGPGADLLTVQRSTAGGTPNFRIFTIANGVTVSLDGMTVTNGLTNSIGGGGIYNQGTLTLTGSTVTGNETILTGPNYGGGIYNVGALTLTNSTVSNNKAGPFEFVFSEHSGGGIYNNGGTLTIVNSSIFNNYAIFSNANNYGGGIYIFQGSLTMIDSTVCFNHAQGNGSDAGGGIYNLFGSTNIRNTIIAENIAPQGTEVSGTFSSRGHNLIGNGNGSTGFTNGVNGDQVGTTASPLDPMLGLPGNNGGRTETVALLAGSPAIDAGDDCVFDNTCTPPVGMALATDQRGTGFTRKFNTHVDIGAFEVQNIPTPTPTPGPEPEMDVQGNGISIADGDATPSTTDGTDFGLVNTASMGAVQNFTIQNTGNTDLLLTGTPKVQIGGTNASDFHLSIDPTTPIPGSGGSTTFQVVFTPSASGIRTATLSIANNDPDENPYDYAIQGTGINAGALRFSSNAYSVGEGAMSLTITVQRVGGTEGNVGVSYSTIGMSATGEFGCSPGVDFAWASGTISWPPGMNPARTFTVTICDDAISEPDEIFGVLLGNPTGGAILGDPNQAIVTIFDNDPAPTVTPTSTPTATPTATPTPGSCGENFDAVTAPALPAGWTTMVSGAGVPWATESTTPDTPPNDAFAPIASGSGESQLISPPIAVPAGGGSFSFRNNYNSSLGLDGMVLEISINGFPYQDILTAGGNFTAGGYNGTIISGFGSPLGNRMAWSGNSAGYVTTTVLLPAAANGLPMRLRWRLGSSLLGIPGSIRIDSVTCMLGTPTPTATPTPNITGNVDYAIVSKPVPDTQLVAAGSPPLMVFTDSMGNYSLSGFGGGAYTVTPSRVAQPCLPAGPNGIFSNDAALISQHVVGLITLNADQLLAADVSNFHAISSFDAALIAQKVVGICSGLNHSGEWVFTPASVPHPGGVVGSLTENYTAVMIGDVSGDWSPIGPRPYDTAMIDRTKAVHASVPNTKAAQGSVVTIPLSLANLRGTAVGSYQFDIEYDPAVLAPADIATDLAGTMSEGMSVVSNSPTPGLLKVVVYGAIPASNDGVYVNLQFRALGTAGTRSPVTITSFRMNDGKQDLLITNGEVHIVRSNPATLSGRFLTIFNMPLKFGQRSN